MKTVILDNGHGVGTAGKRSPVWSDGSQLFEFEFNRDIVLRIAEQLNTWGIPYRILVPEVEDVSLTERVRRVNEINKELADNCFLLSIHANAGGGTGWECFTSVGKTKADAIATILCTEALHEFAPDGWRMRFDYSDKGPGKEENFTILAKSSCPAVLSENFFMDTEKDCRFIMSDDGRRRIAKIHCNTILKVYNNQWE